MINAAKKITRARRYGIVNPIRAYQEARRAKIPFAVLCAVLEQETGGGRNVYGHDRDSNGNIIWHGKTGTVPVTRKNYAQYKKWRLAHGNKLMQGVGPCQLTWYSYQDRADQYGGCWNVRYNIRVGCEMLRDSFKQEGNWHGAFKRYNGSEAYADEVTKRLNKWRNLLQYGH